MGDTTAVAVATIARDELMRVLVRPLAALGKNQPADPVAALAVLESGTACLCEQASEGERTAMSIIIRRLCASPAGDWLTEVFVLVFSGGLAAFSACEAIQTQASTALVPTSEFKPSGDRTRTVHMLWERCVGELHCCETTVIDLGDAGTRVFSPS